MPSVGTLKINLVAGTASFESDMKKATGTARASSKEIQDAFNGMDTSEARGGLMLIDDLIGVHMPRHAAAFVSQIPGFAAAFSAMFPLVAVAVATEAIMKAVESAKKHTEEMEKAGHAALDTALAFAKHGEALHISNMKLQDQIDILQRSLPRNAVKIAMEEGKRATDALIDSFQKAIDKESELMSKQQQGFWNKLLNGDNGQNDVIGKAQEFKSQIDDITQEMQTAAALGHKKEADGYKVELDKKIGAFKTYLGQQQVELDNRRKLARDAMMEDSSSAGPNPGEMIPAPGVDAATAKKQAEDQYAPAQRMLNDLIILTHSYGTQQQEIATATSLHEQETAAKTLAKIRDLHEKAGQEIRRIVDENQRHEQEAIAKTDQYLISQDEKENAAKIKFADAYIAFYNKQESNLVRIATLGAQISDQESVHNQRMAVAMGLMSQQNAVQQSLKTLENNRHTAMAAINAEISDQLELTLALKAATNGGETGTDDQKVQYQKSVLAYQDFQAKKLEISKNFTNQENALRLQAANNERSQWSKMFLDFSQVQTHMSQIARQTLGQMNTSIAAFVVTGQGNFRQLAAGAAQSFIEMALQYGESKAFMAGLDAIFGTKKKVENALKANSSAAAGAANTLADVPYPLNIPAAAEVFAMGEMYAADAAAMGGAYLPNREMMVHTHPEEMILPQHISNFVVDAASRASGGGGGHTYNSPVFAPVINAIDASGVDRMLKDHGARFHRHFEEVIKNVTRNW